MSANLGSYQDVNLLGWSSLLLTQTLRSTSPSFRIKPMSGAKVGSLGKQASKFGSSLQCIASMHHYWEILLGSDGETSQEEHDGST